VGKEGSVRLFDLRQLESSSIIYETTNREPLLKIAGNVSNMNQLAIVKYNSNEVVLLDQRKP
jgi:DDB1- and CUL4-associated factor 7